MQTQVVKYRIWNLALRMNPQQATYSSRTLATTPAGKDTFTRWVLTRVVYQPLNKSEEAMVAGNATLADVTKKWVITQVDLEQAITITPDDAGQPALPPQIGFELAFDDGTTWVIRKVNIAPIGQAFECYCAQARPQ